MITTDQHLRSDIYRSPPAVCRRWHTHAENPVADSAPQPTGATATSSPKPQTREIEAQEREAQNKPRPDNIELSKALGILYLEKLRANARVHLRPRSASSATPCGVRETSASHLPSPKLRIFASERWKAATRSTDVANTSKAKYPPT